MRYVVVIRVRSLYVKHIDSEELIAGPFPRPDGWETAQEIADRLNSRLAYGR